MLPVWYTVTDHLVIFLCESIKKYARYEYCFENIIQYCTIVEKVSKNVIYIWKKKKKNCRGEKSQNLSFGKPAVESRIMSILWQNETT